MVICLLLAHPGSGISTGGTDPMINSTLRRWPADTLRGQDEGCGMDALSSLRHRLSVLGTKVLDPTLGCVVVTLSSASAQWVAADGVCL